MTATPDRVSRRKPVRGAFLACVAGLLLVALRLAPADYTGPVADLLDRKPAASTNAPPAKAPPVPVTIGRVTVRDIPIVRSGVGTVTPLSVVDVRSRVDGQIQTLFIREGETVRTGDPLAQLDARSYAAIVEQAQAMREKTLAGLASAEIEDARARKLTSAGAGTLQSADAARAQLAIMKATAAGDKAALDLAKLNLDFTTVRAPIGGRVGLRLVSEGAVVQAGNAAGIVTITQMKPIAVLFSLPQEQLREILAGSRAGTLSVAAEEREGGGVLAEGTLSVVDSQVDPGTGMIRLKALFANDDDALWPGQFVTARILVRTLAKATVVPVDAIQNGQKGPYVFVVNADRTVSVRSVRPGPGAGGFTALLDGLESGTEIILRGQARLTDGSRIEPLPVPAPPAVSATSSARG